MWRKGNPPTLLVGLLTDIASMEKSMEIPLKKTGNKSTICPETPLLGINLEKTTIPKDTCTPLFTVAIFTIVRTWK